MRLSDRYTTELKQVTDGLASIEYKWFVGEHDPR